MTRNGFVVLTAMLGSLGICARFGWFPGLVISALLCLGLSLVIGSFAPSREKAAELDLKARAKRFRALRRQIRRRKSAPLLLKISKRIHELIEHIRRDPKNLEAAEELISHHLPKAQDLVEEYARLVNQPSLGARHEKELAEMETTIRLLESALATLNRRLLAQDVDTFSVDRRGFEEILRLDFTPSDGLPLDLKDPERTDRKE